MTKRIMPSPSQFFTRCTQFNTGSCRARGGPTITSVSLLPGAVVRSWGGCESDRSVAAWARLGDVATGELGDLVSELEIGPTIPAFPKSAYRPWGQRAEKHCAY